MRVDTAIQRYVGQVGAGLHGTDAHRRRVLEEIEGHLRDATARHVDAGLDPDLAARRAIQDFGPADAVANELSAAPSNPTDTRAQSDFWWKWAPAALPVTLAAVSMLFFLYALTWIPSMTAGQRAALPLVARGLVLHGALAVTAVELVRRSHARRSQPWPAWTVSAIAVAVFASGFVRA